MKKGISKERTLKKIEIAIDKMVDLQDAGYGNAEISRILDQLNELWSNINRSK